MTGNSAATSGNSSLNSDPAKVAARAKVLFSLMKHTRIRRTDRLLAGLLVIEWLAAIVVAVIVSPFTWAGEESQIHVHLWAALFLALPSRASRGIWL